MPTRRERKRAKRATIRKKILERLTYGESRIMSQVQKRFPGAHKKHIISFLKRKKFHGIGFLRNAAINRVISYYL